MIGQLLDGRYQVIRVLGAGGFGQTYIAEDIKIPGHPSCVVKQLKPDSSSSPKLLETARRLFQREAESLAKLSNCDQIPRLLAYNDQEFYLVQEFIEGQPLRSELIPGQRWNDDQMTQMLQEVLTILEVIHSFGIIHRDIKPDNIIRRASDNKLVLIDFGAIKQARTPALAEEQQVSATIAIGTPGYMPTEQGQGKPRPNSDIYALGIIGIQAATGLEPHKLQEDISTGELIWWHQAQVSPGLADVLTKMVRYHFKDRYQSATEVLQALQQLSTPTYLPTVPTVVASIGWVHELTLEWVEAGEVITRTLSNKQRSKNLGTVCIGRDAQSCDIVLSEPTVAGLHIEIFFNPQQQCFYLRSLHPNEPPVVNGQPLLSGEIALSPGSTLKLGQLELRVSAIALKQQAGYIPIEYPTQPQPTIQRTALDQATQIQDEEQQVTLEYPTQQQGTTPQQPQEQPAASTPQPPSYSAPNTIPTSPAEPSRQFVTSPPNPPTNRSRRPVRRPATSSPPLPRSATTSSSKVPMLVGVGLTAIVGGLGGLAFITNSPIKTNSSSTANITQAGPRSPKTQSQDKGSCFAVVTGNIRSEPTIAQDNIVESSSGEKLAVTGKQTSKGWVEVKRSNGDLAWAHRDVISSPEQMDSCLQTKKIPVRRVEDISRPKEVSPPQTIDLDKSSNGFSSSPQTIDLDKSTNTSSSSPQLDNSRQPANASSSSPQPDNFRQPANTPSSFPQRDDFKQPINGSNSSPKTINLDKPTSGSNSSPQTINLDKPTNNSSSSNQPSNPKPSTNSSSSSNQPSNSKPSTNSSSSSSQSSNPKLSTNSSSLSPQSNTSIQFVNGLTSSSQTINLHEINNDLNSSQKTVNLEQTSNNSNPSLNSDRNLNHASESGFVKPLIRNSNKSLETFCWNIPAPECFYQ